MNLTEYPNKNGRGNVLYYFMYDTDDIVKKELGYD